MKYSTTLQINDINIANQNPVYFIADIAANHDGDLKRALDLIWLAKEAGASCAKFQHFQASKIVSDFGFRNLSANLLSHQKDWSDTVYKTYDLFHTKREWNDKLISECNKADIHFMTTPYDLEAVEAFEDKMDAYKIGSGDITFKELVEKIASKNKPTFLATGASNLEEVKKTVSWFLKLNKKLCLMQCNTNYTGKLENFNYVNLNVLKTFSKLWPGLILGLSDHTPGNSAVLGAVALGARVIEKHFTDDNSRTGPDHSFALNPKTWREMVDRTQELEMSLGDGVKKIEQNEIDTVIIQRRSMRLKNDKSKGEFISFSDLEALRPCPKKACTPNDLKKIVGKRLTKFKKCGEEIYWTDLDL